MAFNADDATAQPPELITFDEQVVACEVEIDTFEDVEYVDEDQQGTILVDHYVERHEPPETGDYDYQYEADDTDPNEVYLFDEDTAQIHQINTSHNETEDEDIDVQYVEDTDPSSSSIPSTSSAPDPSSFQSTSSATSFTMHQRGIPNSGNTFIIQKTNERNRSMPVYSPVSFQTTYSESVCRNGKRVIKRTHAALTSEDMESIMEESQVMKRIQKEISQLKKANDEMKKTFELSHRRLESINLVYSEAKLKQKEATAEKRKLQQQLTLARATNTQLAKQGIVQTRYHFQHQ
ncbi:hypothetical protein CRE_28583 [Caenorhabditis remanei]|uniref:Uncharacterized protein n=1 Tax=Caenorhabditis remanei TaxID=31234 RepID=E3LN67_CAERE|nr:hypothetical protein CRE_28583 [Caenorhabditis remanei]